MMEWTTWVLSYGKYGCLYIIMTVVLIIGCYLTTDEQGYVSNKSQQKTMYQQTKVYMTEKAYRWFTYIDTWVYSFKRVRIKHHQSNGETRSSRNHRYTRAKTVVVMPSTSSPVYDPDISFDSDSRLIGVDNRCSACITHVREDIPGKIVPSNRTIQAFTEKHIHNVYTGTIHWTWEDDEGVPHEMIIPNSYYVPEGKAILLSPQHWAQERQGKDKFGGAGSMTTATQVILFWSNHKYHKTIPIATKGNNVATVQTLLKNQQRLLEISPIRQKCP